MLAPDGGSTPTKSDFEKMGHAQLKAMLNGADAASVNAIADHLQAASQHIQELSDQLAGHINGLDWQSQAGDAFKSWARQVVQSTDQLSDYANSTSLSMSAAGGALADGVHAMPDVPTESIATVQAYKQATGLNPPPLAGSSGVPSPSPAPTVTTGCTVTAQQAAQAQSVVDSAHQEAIGAMEKVGSAYESSTTSLSAATAPTFPPTPLTLMPPDHRSDETSVPVSVRPSGTSSTSPSIAAPGSVVSSAPSAPSARTSLDGLAVAPAAPPTTAASGGAVAPTGDPVGGTPVAVPGAADGFRIGAGSRAGISGRVRGGQAVDPVAEEVAGGLPGVGRRGVGGTTGVVGGEEGVVGGLASGRPAGFGGRAIGVGEGSAGLEGGGAGLRGPAGIGGRGLGGSTPGVPGEPGAVGGASARPATPGESVSGGTAGAAASAERGGAAGGAPMGGMPGAGGVGGHGRRSGRAGYLVEDEETWTGGVPDAGPGVVE